MFLLSLGPTLKQLNQIRQLGVHRHFVEILEEEYKNQLYERAQNDDETGGRPRNACWDELSFLLKKENGKNVAFCQGCKRVLSNTAEKRLRNHRKKCVIFINAEEDLMQLDEISQNNISNMSGVSFDISMSDKILINNNNVDNLQSTDANSNVCVIGLSGKDELPFCPPDQSVCRPAVILSASKRPVDTRSKIKRQKSLKPFLDEIKEREKKSIDKALGNLLFANNIEIDIVESNYFKEFLRIIRPAYSPPTFEIVSTTLLNESFASFQMRNDEKQQSKKEQEFERIAIEAIELALLKHNLSIFVIVSKEISLLTHLISNVWLVPCNIKIANLATESLTDVIIYNNVRFILSACEKDENVKKLLVIDAKKTPVIIDNLDEEQCWRTHFQSYSYFLNNVKVLRQKIGEGLINFNQLFTTLVFDESFKFKVENIHAIYMTMAELIERFQQNDFFIGDAVQSWIDLYSNSLKSEDKKSSSTIAEHLNLIKRPVCLTANFLHPSYKGHKLNANEMAIVKDFFLEYLDEDGLKQVSAYENGKGIFSKLFQKQIKSPAVFWNIAQQEAFKLSKLALKLSLIPASSINNVNCRFRKQRNLTSEQSEKLVNLYYNLRIYASKI